MMNWIGITLVVILGSYVIWDFWLKKLFERRSTTTRTGDTERSPKALKIGFFILMLASLAGADWVINQMYPGFGQWLLVLRPFPFLCLIVVTVLHALVLVYAWKSEKKDAFVSLVVCLFVAVIVIGSVRGIATYTSWYTFGLERTPVLGPNSIEHITFVEHMAQYNKKDKTYSIRIPIDVGGVIVIDPNSRKQLQVNFGSKVYVHSIRVDSISLPQPVARFPVRKTGAYQLIREMGKDGKIVKDDIFIRDLAYYQEWKIEHPNSLYAPSDESVIAAPLIIVQGYALPIYENHPVYYADTVSDRRVIFTTNMPKQMISRGEGSYVVTFSMKL